MLTLAGALAIAVPVAWASDIFADVPNTNPFHDDIGAIARAGVTKGCGTGVYCPSDNVTREAMAAFMHRGFGRVAVAGTNVDAVPTSESSILDVSITPGLPAGALAGARGFVKADAAFTVNLSNATSCPCTFRGALFMTGQDYLVPFYTDVTLTTVGEKTVMAMTGAIAVPSAGAKTVEVRIFRLTGSGIAGAYGNVTATYFPFGNAGGNTLSIQGSPAGATATG